MLLEIAHVEDAREHRMENLIGRLVDGSHRLLLPFVVRNGNAHQLLFAGAWIGVHETIFSDDAVQLQNVNALLPRRCNKWRAVPDRRRQVSQPSPFRDRCFARARCETPRFETRAVRPISRTRRKQAYPAACHRWTPYNSRRRYRLRARFRTTYSPCKADESEPCFRPSPQSRRSPKISSIPGGRQYLRQP